MRFLLLVPPFHVGKGVRGLGRESEPRCRCSAFDSKIGRGGGLFCCRTRREIDETGVRALSPSPPFPSGGTATENRQSLSKGAK